MAIPSYQRLDFENESQLGFHALDFTRFNTVVLSNTKCASTLLKFAYARLQQGIATRDLDDQIIHRTVRVFDTFTLEEVKSYINSRRQSHYVIVGRNPYRRVVSAFLDKRVFGESEAEQSELGGDTFVDFIDKLYQIREGRLTLHTRRVAPLGLNHLPNFHKINIDERDLVEELISFWDLSRGEKEWLKRLPRFKNTSIKNGNHAHAVDLLPETPIAVLRQFPRGSLPPDGFWTANTKNKVAQIYQEDLILFG